MICHDVSFKKRPEARDPRPVNIGVRTEDGSSLTSVL
jgi:hypothetical protein